MADEGPIVPRVGALQFDEIPGSGLTPRPFFMPGNERSATACPSVVHFFALNPASR